MGTQKESVSSRVMAQYNVMHNVSDQKDTVYLHVETRATGIENCRVYIVQTVSVNPNPS